MTTTVQLHGICLHMLFQRIVSAWSPLHAHSWRTYSFPLVQYQTCKILHGRCWSAGALSKSSDCGHDDGHAHCTYDHFSCIWARVIFSHSSTPLQKIQRWEKNIQNRPLSSSSRSYRLVRRNRGHAFLAHWNDSFFDWIGGEFCHGKIARLSKRSRISRATRYSICKKDSRVTVSTPISCAF